MLATGQTRICDHKAAKTFHDLYFVGILNTVSCSSLSATSVDGIFMLSLSFVFFSSTIYVVVPGPIRGVLAALCSCFLFIFLSLGRPHSCASTCTGKT